MCYTRRVRILVADDEDGVRLLLSHLLSKAGYGVKTVASVEEAVRVLGCERFDLLFTDIHMPGASGYELIAAARKLAPKMPVIVMSSDIEYETARKAYDLSIQGFLTKPFEDIDEVLKKIRHVLDLRALTGKLDGLAAGVGKA